MKKILKGETALLATSSFMITNNSFFGLFLPPKYMKSHLWQAKIISNFLRDRACPPGLPSITSPSYKQPDKLPQLQNTQLNLLTVTFLAI